MNMIKSLTKLTQNLNYEVLSGSFHDLEINKLCYDARSVAEDDLFICIKGARFDTHSIIPDIINSGAKVIIVDKDSEYVAEGSHSSPVRSVEGGSHSPLILAVENTRIALAIISANYFDNPSDKLKISGITGTKGKTTTAFMIRNILM